MSLILPPPPIGQGDFSPFFTLFRSVPEFPGYGADSDGGVWSCQRRGIVGGFDEEWRRMRVTSRKGYEHVHFAIPGRPDKAYLFGVHQIVLMTFVGPCPDGMEGCHNDGRPWNNALRNLRWDTRKANRADAIEHGTHRTGSRSHYAKLSEDDIPVIRRRAAAGEKQDDIGKDYGVSGGGIGRIARGETWKKVPIGMNNERPFEFEVVHGSHLRIS